MNSWQKILDKDLSLVSKPLGYKIKSTQGRLVVGVPVEGGRWEVPGGRCLMGGARWDVCPVECWFPDWEIQDRAGWDS